jgi:hypothetical protein
MTPAEIERMTADLLQLYSDIEDDLLTNVAYRQSSILLNDSQYSTINSINF